MSCFSKPLQLNKGLRIPQIDFIKAIAIIAILVIHSVPSDILFAAHAPFHLWQAIPVFMVIAGITSTLSSTKQNRTLRLSTEYSLEKILKHSKRLLIPFTVFWLVEISILAATEGITVKQTLATYLYGGIGQGSYFTPLFIQHLLFFPLIMWLVDRFSSHKYVTLFVIFVLAISGEWLCIQLNISASFYRLLYVRYIFAAALGAFIVKYGFQRSFLVLSLFSAAYITITWHFRIDLGSVIFPAWGSQHAPAFFYAVLLIIVGVYIPMLSELV